MPKPSAYVRNRQVGNDQALGGRGAARRVLLLLAGMSLGLGCVNLTPPPDVVKYRNGSNANSGGVVGPIGGTEAGGNANTGGLVGAGGAMGGGGASGLGGIPGGGGAIVPPDAGRESGPDVSPSLDVATGGGGAAGTGGVLFPDDVAAVGGATGTGGKKSDATPGTGGSAPDGLLGTGGSVGSGGQGTGGSTSVTGGAVSTGGVAVTGGVIGTGGMAAGTGGTPATGGAVGTGGSTATGGSSVYTCANAIVPVSGVVTNFATDWNATTARWGSGTLTGTIYQYAGTGATMSTAKVEGSPLGLHLTGTVPGTNYAGGGLTFLSCVKVSSFTKVQFDVYGSGPNCAIELQLQTFDQRPTDQNPPGGCVKATDGSGCFTFPLAKQVVDLSTTVTTPKTVTATLANFTNWSTTEAGQIVGLQWQFTHTGSSDCAINATFTNIKFVP